ncbi:MAG: T9SS type A sorting domain-containing protein [Ignavibacteriales bacterium]|nr:T9SS type A sorting domain-containing protein [Ignavibacteriales bacterium]
MIKKLCLIFFFSIMFLADLSVAQTSWQSEVVTFDSKGKLVYKIDNEGSRIPDFSYAGYKNGEVDIPFVSVCKTISAIDGDNTVNIQSAVDEVGKLPLVDGIRGALLLKAGKYEVTGTIRINQSGIVLRGESDGADISKSTIIFAKGNTPSQRTVVIAGGGSNNSWNSQVAGTKTNILTDKIYVGEKTFRVENISGYKVGDNIIIVHTNSSAWLKAVDYGGTATDPGWATTDGLTILYNRFIKKISGDTITIDAPVFNTLDRSISQSYIYKYSRSGLMTNIGIEGLRVDIEIPVNDLPTNSNGNEAHAWQAIEMVQIEDAWIKNSTMIHFGQSGIMTSTATRITIDNSKAIDPISIITGERRYNFNMYRASQLILVKNSYTRYGRHDFVSNGTASVSGCVFYNNISEKTYSSSEGHRWWSQGLLFDNLTYNSPNMSYVIGFYNRGDYGTSHGWAAVHSVAWNCIVNGGKNIIIQKPPTAQNYAIGCSANLVTGKTPYAPYSQPEGYIDGTNFPGLNPKSLYLAQLNERLGEPTSVKEQMGRSKYSNGLKVFSNYPNPFNSSTTISYELENPLSVKVVLYDSIGRKMQTIDQGEKGIGKHSVQINSGALSSGNYFCVFNLGSDTAVQKIVLLK